MNHKETQSFSVRTSYALPCLLVLVALACSDKSADSTGGGSGGQASSGGDGDGDADEGATVVIPTEGPVDATDLPVFMAQIACQKVEECGCLWAELGTCQKTGQCFADELDCRIRFARSLGNFSTEESPYSIEYDPEAGRACVDAGLAAGCDHVFWEEEPCQRMVVGTASLGDMCTLHFECQGFAEGAAHCSEEDGVCKSGPEPTDERPRGERGSACEATCREDVGCAVSDDGAGDAACHVEDGLQCVVGVCESVGVEGDPCHSTLSCQDGTFCNGTHCAPYREIGENCSREDDLPCGSNAFCDGSVCSERLDLRQACEYDEDCASDTCAAHSMCVEKGTRPVCAM